MPVRSARPRSIWRLCAAGLWCLSVLLPVNVSGQPPTPAPAVQAGGALPPGITFFARNTTRIEHWRYFEPHPGGGDPVYTTFANRLTAGVRQSTRRVDWTAALQYVHLANLPDRSIGPGPLGTGATYYDHLRERSSGYVYLRQLNVHVRDVLPHLDVRAGRLLYTSGAEAASDEAAIEPIKRQRLDSRLVGEFEWSMYQRAFDGVRVDWNGGDHVRASASALWPTQGGFEEHGGKSLRDVRVLTASMNLRALGGLRHTELQAFAFGYDDTRAVTARPDNTRTSVAAADISIQTFGGSVVGAYPAGPGRIDAVIWIAFQTGDWYELSHGASAFALEAGYQWPSSPGRPWVRGGWNHASGDDDAADGEHETFFPMLPTARKYALSAVYTFMNLDDRFVQVMFRPHPTVATRADLHVLGLAGGSDLWYVGSGATRRAGAIFGYAGRRGDGSDSLATIVETATDWTITSHWSVNGYVGFMRGGDVVRSLFAEDHLTFAYFEHVIQF